MCTAKGPQVKKSIDFDPEGSRSSSEVTLASPVRAVVELVPAPLRLPVAALLRLPRPALLPFRSFFCLIAIPQTLREHDQPSIGGGLGRDRRSGFQRDLVADEDQDVVDLVVVEAVMARAVGRGLYLIE